MGQINELVKACHDNAVAHGFHTVPRVFGEDIALIHSEASEAFEEYRNGNVVDAIYYDVTESFVMDSSPHSLHGLPRKPEGVPIELADVVIRVMDTCGLYGIDLEEALRLKMEYNATRPIRHGGKVV